jgi:hypothetical protein
MIAVSIGALILSFVMGFQNNIGGMVLGILGTCAFLFVAFVGDKASSIGTSEKKSNESLLYTWLEPNVRDFKVLLQMMVGAGILVILVAKLTCQVIPLQKCFSSSGLPSPSRTRRLRDDGLSAIFSLRSAGCRFLSTPGSR